ncbi:MAG: hypothetical protein V4601_13130, partial [Pseudomonadota bacterium]
YGKPFRDVGGSGQPRGLPESMRLHGKLLLDEMDQEPPSFGKPPKEAAGLLGDSVATLRRNLAQAHSQGHGLWFYDFGPGRASKGWWDDATLMKEVTAMRSLFAPYYDKPHVPQADVALVYDTDSFYYTAAYGDQDPVIGPQLVDLLPTHAYRSGAAIDIFHLGDLNRAEWGRYKCVVFANCFLLTPAQKDVIRRRVARDGRHIVWLVAPGYTDGARIDAAMIRNVTGINVTRHTLNAPPQATIQIPGLTAKLQVSKTFSPLFTVNDPAATTLGTMDSGGATVLARKRLGSSHTSWFSSLPPLNDGLLGHLFKEAGAHMYVPPGDVIHAGGGIICSHSATGGNRDVLLKNGKRLRVSLPPRSTAIY